jgi:hypothetical protein
VRGARGGFIDVVLDEFLVTGLILTRLAINGDADFSPVLAGLEPEGKQAF